ncbi:MAG: SDR family NAD(P)-dependent oxidoreductase [Candidatus Hydrogenedentes bacterium]|jgi:NAD(P)-dependent dehydrogenase (short-subunit alcohol dehydrogenase family)|nr:SDR family NAD(P)-dependent oxidoreductase [Candidatus Hydrogenedentota bacterium]
MTKVLEGKVVVITGAGRGIGRGEAIAFAEAGARVVVNDLGGGGDGVGSDKAPAKQVVDEIKALGGEAVANADSVADVEGAENIIQTAIDAFGQIDILVNNAGILRDKMVFNMSDEEWDIVQKVHLYGHFYCTRAASRHMRKQKWGRIINTSSTAGLASGFGQANYGSAKEGIVGLTRNVARDMAKYNVTCNAIRPTAASRLTLNPDLIAAWERAGRVGARESTERNNPDDIAPFIVFLCTKSASNISGRTFEVVSGQISLHSEPVREKTIFKQGRWTVEELIDIVPGTLGAGLEVRGIN